MDISILIWKPSMDATTTRSHPHCIMVAMRDDGTDDNRIPQSRELEEGGKEGPSPYEIPYERLPDSRRARSKYPLIKDRKNMAQKLSSSCWKLEPILHCGREL